MTSTRKPKSSAVDEELGELFEGIDKAAGKAKKVTKAKPGQHAAAISSKVKGAGSGTAAAPGGTSNNAVGSAANAEPDILADLENQLSVQTPSRPLTPKIKEPGSAKSSAAKRAATAVGSSATPSHSTSKPADPRISTDSSRSYHHAMTPSDNSVEDPEKKPEKRPSNNPETSTGGGGGWWGGIFATATATAAAAVKQAEGVYSNLQQSEEAKRWTEQVKGNVGALRGLGDELRHRALPTFQNLLETLAPPISQHERLRIHVTHSMVGYPSLDSLVHDVFSRVMSQVEGGDLLVVQRGQEIVHLAAASKAGSSAAETGNSSTKPVTLSSRAQPGWKDGPWWRSMDVARDIGLADGLYRGTKLCRARAEDYAREYYSANGGLEKAKRLAQESASESNPVRTSDLFIAVQAVLQFDSVKQFTRTSRGAMAKTLRLAGKAETNEDNDEDENEDEDEDADEDEDEDEDEEEEDDDHDDDEEEKDKSPKSTKPSSVYFAVYVHDPVHELAYSTVSQGVPSRWIKWLNDDFSSTSEQTSKAKGVAEAAAPNTKPSTEIRDIIESGGVDPREWVSEWIEEALDLSIGVVAQRYVARRMGVGDGGIGKGKQRPEVILEEGGGEVARAGLI